MMPMIPEQETTIRYIRDRRCVSGGYCFYRLDEPNAGDTFHALASLAMLGTFPNDDDATRSYLRTFQHPEGRFSNVNVGHAVIRSLMMFNERPLIDPPNWILSLLVPPGDSVRPVESSSLFEHLYLLTDLCTLLGIAIPTDIKSEIIRAVFRYQHPDTGFGYPRSTIIETAHALAILEALGYPVLSTGSEVFLKQCEDPAFGFLAVPGTKPAYLEHVHAGILACSVLNHYTPVFVQCEEFIKRCCRENGGYVRSIFGGSATLENTYLALDALTMIGHMRQDPIRRQEADNPLRCCD
ncbi:MAG: hypothetical protein NTZ39_11285 [Methanoregula sp.]|nr:hypothetical protein [Methanoregula sp.]